MINVQRLKKFLPKPVFNFIKKLVRNILKKTLRKNGRELTYWEYRFQDEGGTFKNDHYKTLMLAMAERNNAEFVREKIVADFGCGPRGSLVWAKEAKIRIGVDVLADRYADLFASNIIQHGMIYLKSTEKIIPLPSEFVDIVFTLNAIDRTNNFSEICREIHRILIPNGEFIASFNLEEPPSMRVAQRFNEEKILANISDKFNIISYRTAPRLSEDDPYAPFFSNEAGEYHKGQRGFLWMRAVKK